MLGRGGFEYVVCSECHVYGLDFAILDLFELDNIIKLITKKY